MDHPDLTQYRLNDYEWVDRLMTQFGKDEFWAYLNNVWKAIEALHPFQFYSLHSVPPEKKELFIKFGCEYIIEHGGCEACGIQFSNDYTKIERYKQIRK